MDFYSRRLAMEYPGGAAGMAGAGDQQNLASAHFAQNRRDAPDLVFRAEGRVAQRAKGSGWVALPQNIGDLKIALVSAVEAAGSAHQNHRHITHLPELCRFADSSAFVVAAQHQRRVGLLRSFGMYQQRTGAPKQLRGEENQEDGGKQKGEK